MDDVLNLQRIKQEIFDVAKKEKPKKSE